ncbi:hypothetical protein [Salinibacter pepae]|uniref:flagellin n=1 Tax=Salinibacter pepae TaxID=3040382 RepID=UPI0024345D27|nr:hypothetical protein [Salinibacter pepae]
MANVSIATNSSVYSGVISDEVPRLQRDISRLREQISSGTRINRPSDDPASFATAERMKTLGNKLARREESIASARTFVDRTQQELDGLADLFTTAREDGVRAAGDTRSDDDRRAIADELRSIKDEVVDRMNSTQDGEYIFAGNRTDTQPFNEDGDVNSDAPINGALDALDGDRTRPIGKNQDLTVNVDGKALAQYGTTAGGDPKTITGALDNLIKAVDPADNAPERAAGPGHQHGPRRGGGRARPRDFEGLGGGRDWAAPHHGPGAGGGGVVGGQRAALRRRRHGPRHRHLGAPAAADPVAGGLPGHLLHTANVPRELPLARPLNPSRPRGPPLPAARAPAPQSDEHRPVPNA